MRKLSSFAAGVPPQVDQFLGEVAVRRWYARVTDPHRLAPTIAGGSARLRQVMHNLLEERSRGRRRAGAYRGRSRIGEGGNDFVEIARPITGWASTRPD